MSDDDQLVYALEQPLVVEYKSVDTAPAVTPDPSLTPLQQDQVLAVTPVQNVTIPIQATTAAQNGSTVISTSGMVKSFFKTPLGLSIGVLAGFWFMKKVVK